jgi:oligopeptidase B
MRTKTRTAIALAGVAAALTACVTTRMTTPPQPPVAARHPQVRDLHGDRFIDDYFWLREKTNPAVVAYLKAENAYTAQAMKPTAPLQAKLYREMVGRIQETDRSVPFPKGTWQYYSRTEKGRQYPTYWRKPLAGAGTEQVVLDVNALAQGQPFMSVGAREVSDDGRWLAFTTDNTGFRQYQLQVREIATGQPLPATAERVTSVVWAADNRTLFYTTEDAVTKRSNMAFRLAPESAPELVFEEKDERFSVSLDRTRSGAFVVLTAGSRTASELRLLSAGEPRGVWRLVAAREPDHEYDLDHRGDRFFIRSNKPGRNFGLFSAPAADPAPANWTPVIAHRADTMIESMVCFARRFVVHERVAGLVRFRVMDYDGGEVRTLRFADPAYNAEFGPNEEFNSNRFRYAYSSPATPPSVFDHDLESGQDFLLKREPVLGGFDSANYVVERHQARARDGTLIPVSILCRKGTPRDGRSRLYLAGYGAYGIPSDAGFDAAKLSLVDRGMICAIAHIRGGGDLGKPWHDAGRMANKMNTFTDFIDAAEFLVSEGYTAPDRLAIGGGSAGGLLMGAVTNLRPDLFRAVLAHVPFVDVINTMSDESLPLTVEEFEEWGNPKVAAQYAWLRAYCPYTNLERKAYPAILVKTSLNDSQVMYWEPAKYVARLRTLKTDPRPLLLHVNMAAGHGGASGRYDHLKERAFDYAFLLDQVGIRQ